MSTDGRLANVPAGAPAVVRPESREPMARRDVALAIVIVALLLAGVALGALRAAQAPAVAAAIENEAQEAGEFVYFPSQYVNQGVEVPEDVPTF